LILGVRPKASAPSNSLHIDENLELAAITCATESFVAIRQ